ncbi:MAG: LEA type 2 family protein [Phycisphaerales bacterium]|nr:LEA type 2 family protein [Phycisphaerales bacterium]MCB9837294.1 LEA type 2 family protein [Phycisphaera sp.]
MRTLTPTLFLLLTLIASGCSSYDAPKIDVVGARISQETAEGVVIDFTLDATNTNEVDLPFERVRYALKLNGQRVFSGTRSAEATVRRLGTQQFTLPAAIDLAEFEMPEGNVEYELAGSVVYVTPGEIAQLLFDAGVRKPRSSFRQMGVLDFGAGGSDLNSAP